MSNLSLTPSKPSFGPPPIDKPLQDQIAAASRTHGNQSQNVIDTTRAYTRDRQGGKQAALKKELQSLEVQVGDEKQYRREATHEMRHLEPKVPVKGQRRPMGLTNWLTLLFLTLGLLTAIWIEQTGAGQALLDTGAFGVDTLWKGIGMTMSAVTVGFAAVLGFKALAPYLRRRMFGGACVLLVAVFFTYAFNFARVTDAARKDAELSLKVDGGGQGASADNDEEAAGTTLSATGAAPWLMFFSLFSAMALTTFIGHRGIEHYLDTFQVYEPSKDYLLAQNNRQLADQQIVLLDQRIAERTGRLESLQAEEEMEVARALIYYRSLREDWQKHLIATT